MRLIWLDQDDSEADEGAVTPTVPPKIWFLFRTPTCSYRNNHLPWLPKLLSEIWCWLTSWETWDRNSFAVDTPGTWRCDFQSHFRLFWKVCYRNQLWPNLLSLKWNAWTLLGRENPVASLPVKRQGRWGQTLKNKCFFFLSFVFVSTIAFLQP